MLVILSQDLINLRCTLWVKNCRIHNFNKSYYFNEISLKSMQIQVISDSQSTEQSLFFKPWVNSALKSRKKVNFLKPCVTSDPQNREKKLILQKPWQSIDPQSKVNKEKHKQKTRI